MDKKNPHLNHLVMLLFLVSILWLLTFIGGCSTAKKYTVGGGVGSKGSIIGENFYTKNTPSYIADFGITKNYPLKPEWKLSVDVEGDVGVIINQGNAFPKTSGDGLLVYSFTKNLDFRVGGGLALIYDGGDIDGLSQAACYGSLKGGFRYKAFRLEIDHYSSPFHDDSGINFLKFTYEW